jgi:HSP20 family protein
MTIIRRPSPFGDLLSLRNAMERLFDEPYFRPASSAGDETLAMPLDIYGTAEALVVEAALPGVRPEDVDVSILGDTLTLTASNESERTEEQPGYHVREVRRGRFSRTVSLPSGLDTDRASATFEHGMLRLSIPKAEQAKPRQIRVSATTEGQATPVTAGETRSSGTSATGEQPAGG